MRGAMPETRNGLIYTIRESNRAKTVKVLVWQSGQVEVVIPAGYKRSRVPRIIDLKTDWIEQQLRNLPGKRRTNRPRVIQLRALDEKWGVRYDLSSAGNLSVVQTADCQLTVIGKADTGKSINGVLNSWVRQKAINYLPPALDTLSRSLNIDFHRVAVRRQKTLWGSCSSKGHISLNQNLMFLPPEMVGHVLAHELCHIRLMNHSSEFWSLLEQFVPDSKNLRIKFEKAIYMIPVWARP